MLDPAEIPSILLTVHGPRLRMIQVASEGQPAVKGEWSYLDDTVNIVAFHWCDLVAGLAKYVPEGSRLVAVLDSKGSTWTAEGVARP